VQSVEPTLAPAPALATAKLGSSHSALRSHLVPWLRFLLPNVLLLVALNGLYVDLDYQLAGEEWLPLILCVITLMVGALFSLGKPRTLGLIHLFWARLWWLAAVPVFLLMLSTLPPVRRAIIVYEHSSAIEWRYFPGPLGLAQRRDLYAQEFCEALLIRPGVIENRLANYQARLSPYTEIWQDRHELALYFAALRLRGESVASIAARPLGPHLLVATLLAEADPPYWLPKADWLLEALQAQPAGSFRVGLVDRAWVRGQLKKWCNADYLAAVLTREQSDSYDPFSGAEAAWRLHGQRGSLVRGLLQISLLHHQLIDETSLAFILDQQLKHAAPSEALAGVEAAIQARAMVRHWAAPTASPRGQWPVNLVFESASLPYASAQQVVRQGITDFIRNAGYEIADSTSALPIHIELKAQTFSEVPYSTESQTQIEKTETIRRLSGTYYTRPTSEQKRVTYNDRRVHEGRGQLTLPTLTLQWDEQYLSLPPAMLVDKRVSDSALARLTTGGFPPTSDQAAVINLYYHSQDAALSAWRFGLPSRSEPDSLLHLDNWDDVPREIRQWD